MKSYKSTTIEDVMADAKKSAEKKEYLKELVKTRGLKNSKGEPRRITFLEIKRRYFEKFYPELVPVSKAKKKTFYEMIEEL